MHHSIRPVTSSDQQFLWEMLYQSVHVPQGSLPLPRNVTAQPELAKYVKAWGRAGDIGFIAVDVRTGEPVGAVWLRLLIGEERGYGYVDDETPEMGIAILPERRGQGIGSDLLRRLLTAAAATYRSVCLSVSADNPAVRLYTRVGFEPIGERGAVFTMVKRFGV